MFQSFADWLVYVVFRFDPASKLWSSINFFVYDSVKILWLIFFIVSIIAFAKTFFPPHTIKNTLSRQRFGIGNFSASMLGAVTPFCSCSSIPLFVGFLRAEVPLGIAFSFIITSPLVNEVVFILMGGVFWWKIAILYALAGIFLGVFAGSIIWAFKLEKEICLDSNASKKTLQDTEYLPKQLEGKIQYALNDGIATVKKLWIIIIIGVWIGAIIHGYVPSEFFTQYLQADSWLAIPIVTLIGIPIYAGCSTLVPVVFAFVEQGVPLGTALAFMMSIAALSLPEAIMLKRVMTLKLLTIFFGVVAVGIMIIGYAFNIFVR